MTFLLVALGVPALVGIRQALPLAPWRFSVSFRFLDLAACVGIGFLFLIGAGIATDVLIWIAVGIKAALSALS